MCTSQTAQSAETLTGTGVRGIVITESYVNLLLSDAAAEERQELLGYLYGDFRERAITARSPQALIQLLDRLGIRRAQFNIPSWNDLPAAKAVLATYPDRFAASIRVDPHEGMPLLRRIEEARRDLQDQLTSISVLPFLCSPRTPPDDKHYYPLYAKCSELGLPININVGIAGPRQPSAVQNPIYLDEVCYDFPDLTIVMRHGGDPWADVCVKLLLKWPNLYYCTDAWTPKHYRKEIIDFANTRGADKIIYGGYFPVLSYDRIFRELAELPLRDHVWEPFLSGNARRVYGI